MQQAPGIKLAFVNLEKKKKEETKKRQHQRFFSNPPPLPIRTLFRRLLHLLLAELLNLQFHILIEALLQLRSVAKEEQDFHPDEKRSKEQGLDEVVEQGRGTFLESTVPDELCQPRDHMNSPGVVIHDRAVASEQVVAARCGPDHQWRDQPTGDGLEEDIEDGVDKRSDRSGIGWEVFDFKDIRNGEERWAVACLGLMLALVWRVG